MPPFRFPPSPTFSDSSKFERRSNGGNGSRALADALNSEVALIHQAAKDALIDIDALDFIEAHFKGLPLDEAGLMDDPQVRDISLGRPAVKPSRRRQVQGRNPGNRRQGQTNEYQHVGGDHAPQYQKSDHHDPSRDCRKKVHQCSLVEYSTFSPGCKISSI
jgi:hypothetical protein